MRLFFAALAAALTLVQLHATPLTLDGDITYNITEPRLTFELDGKLQNNNAYGSGSLKVILWATENPYPSAGYNVGEINIGDLPSGFQFKDATFKTPSKLPMVSGLFNFTIAIAEYTGTSWQNVMVIPTGTVRLQNGDIVNQKKWVGSKNTVLAAPPLLLKGDVFKLTLKATDQKNQFPVSLQEQVTVTLKSKTRAHWKGPGGKASADYLYKLKKGRYNNKSVPCASLYLDFASAANSDETSNVTLTLFFQGAATGTYKSIVKSDSGNETTWGVFTLK